ncbi:MAG TPA: NAD-dependent epimerase/dehydratase family protein [Acidimicrobiales bacterium]|nr:NAD-dependent epimerase/dehydratase family protein [Acidimicrobiales bacterium]
MRLLVLGGTSFVGRHIVEAALDGGHDVTLFNRGQTNPGLFDGCEQRHGDRDKGDYASLADGTWDAVLDVNAYIPRVVREVAAALDGRVGHYTFVSTVSVYVVSGDDSVDESTELATLDDPTTEVVDNETYGGLKVLCEREVTAAFRGRSTIVRPGIVAGPFDPTDRFTYWVRRAARGGIVAAPARPDQPVQVVHARDLADFTVGATAEGLEGPFNAVGPTEPMTLAGLIEACAAAARSDVEVEWVDESFLREQRVRMPLYVPSHAQLDGVFRCSPAKALAAGLHNRPVTETAADTLAWDRTRGDTAMEGAPTPEQEAALLEAWRTQ